LIAGGKPGLEIPAVHDREPKSAGWHWLREWIAVLVERDLDARDAGHRKDFLYLLGSWVLRSPVRRAKQHDAESIAAVAVDKCPLAVRIKLDQCLDPTATVKIGPLFTRPEVHFDDEAADRFDVDHAGVVAKMPREPSTDRCFQCRFRIRVDRPVVERATACRPSGDVTPPAHPAADDRGVRADVAALEKGHPHVTRRVVAVVIVA